MFNFVNKKNTGILKIISLGGVGNVTKNMYVYEYGNDILLVDCGVGFPDEAMPGIDLVIPDISYLSDKKNKIRGMLITHGHDDHIGALPYIYNNLPDIPIFASRLAAAFIEEKFKEFNINKKVTVLEKNRELNLGKFRIDWIHITHSIPDTVNYIIQTPIGNIYHGSDFKFDWTPIDEKPPEIAKIAIAGQRGILCLLSDCLGAERKGATLSEKVIEETFETEIANCPGKFIVTTQSSNISRLELAIKVGLKNNRLIATVGKSIEKSLEIAHRLSYVNIPRDKFVRTEDIPKYPPKSLLLLVSGSQGQESSALSRITNGDHPSIKINKGDVVVFSSDPIPGNENNVYTLIDTLCRLGARVSYSDVRDELHVSGHGSQNDLLLLLSLTRPKYVFPIGGTFRHMQQYSLLAQSLGYSDKQIILGENGRILELSESDAKLNNQVDLENVMIDGLGVGDVGDIVLRDRRQMSKDGIVVVIVHLSEGSSKEVGEPDIISRGFVYMKESEDLISEAKKVINLSLINNDKNIKEWQFIKKKIEEDLKKFFFKKTKRRPMIVPVIIEV